MAIQGIVVLHILILDLAIGVAGAEATTSVALRWNSAALQGIRDAKLGAPVVARALAIVHTCMYDAWAAYDERAVGTQLQGALRRPASERTLANKEQAIRLGANINWNVQILCSNSPYPSRTVTPTETITCQ